MAIAPIDLQILFTQLDKVGKAQASQKEGMTLQQAVQNVQLQKKTEEHIQEVNETQDTGEGAEKVNDHRQRGDEGGEKKRRENSSGENEDDGQVSVLRDLSLGKNIDISL